MIPKPTNPLLMYVWPSNVVLSPAGMAGLAEGLLGAGRAEAGVTKKVEEIRAAVWRAMRTTILRKGQKEGGGRSMLRCFFTLPLPLFIPSAWPVVLSIGSCGEPLLSKNAHTRGYEVSLDRTLVNLLERANGPKCKGAQRSDARAGKPGQLLSAEERTTREVGELFQIRQRSDGCCC